MSWYEIRDGLAVHFGATAAITGLLAKEKVHIRDEYAKSKYHTLLSGRESWPGSDLSLAVRTQCDMCGTKLWRRSTFLPLSPNFNGSLKDVCSHCEEDLVDSLSLSGRSFQPLDSAAATTTYFVGGSQGQRATIYDIFSILEEVPADIREECATTKEHTYLLIRAGSCVELPRERLSGIKDQANRSLLKTTELDYKEDF